MVFVVIGVTFLGGYLMVRLIDKAMVNVPFMCENCGHTLTEAEDPAERCPVCGS